MTIRITRLDNGATIATHSMPGARTAVAQWSLLGGSQMERPDEHGVGHFLEHLLVDRRSLYEPVDHGGGRINAFTSHSHIAMYAAVMPGDLRDATSRIIGIGLKAPPFGEADFRREFEPIKEEITTRLADAETRLDYLADHAMFGAEPLGHYIAGMHEDIETHSVAKLQAYFARVRRAPGILVAAAGRVRHDSFVRMVEPLLRDLPDTVPDSVAASHFRPGEMLQVEFNEKAEPARREVHLAARFKAASASSSQVPAYQVLGTIMSAGLHSPLYAALRDQGGLVYGVGAGPVPWGNDGYFEVGLTTSQPKIGRATEVAAQTMARLPEFLTDASFERARRKVAFSFAHGQEGPEKWAQRAMMDMRVHGRIRSRDEILQRYNELSLGDVRQAAEAMLTTPPFVAALGPVEGLPAKAVFDRELGRYYSQPA